MNRREFVKLTAIGTLSGISSSQSNLFAAAKPLPIERPNILWISTEDIGPELGCYGDPYAVTPNIDKFAENAIRFDNAFTTAGVCAPMRSATITGMYQNSIGTMHMRCKGVPDPQVKCFSEYLRAAGYYCTNNSKTDYQFDAPFSAWDFVGKKAHWRNRKPGQPFFSIINFTTTHESAIRRPEGRKAKTHDPAKAIVPPYYPDTPLVRNDLACYAENITKMDKQFANVLKQLQDDGLAEDTIVWFWGDHGRGLPRCKRWVYDSGIRIPLIIRVPEKYRKWALNNMPATGSTEQMVSSLDFSATMLSLTDVEIPEHLQGKAFLGPQKRNPRKYVYAARDRIDEAPDCVRTVHDSRYVYIRNFMPNVPYSVNINYMNQMPTMQEMRRLNAEGKLKGPEQQYFKHPRYIEELYDIKNDPHEVNNLASDPKYAKTVKRMNKEMFKWMRDIKDVGLIPEPEFDATKRPNDKYVTAHKPIFEAKYVTDNAPQPIKIISFNAGASIEYKINKGDWKLYTKPVTLKPGQTITAKACRIGFKDSKENSYTYSDPIIEYEYPAPDIHWSDKVYNSDLLESIYEIKSYDGKGAEAIEYYLDKLNDKHASVRYWAVRGLTYADLNDKQNKAAMTQFMSRLHDDSPTVQIAAAQALCMEKPNDHALDVLKMIVKNSHNSARHWALVALDAIGKNARDVLPVIKNAQNDKYNYAKRVANTIMAKDW